MKNISDSSVLAIDPNTFSPVLEKIQESMSGAAEEAGLENDDDVMALVREVRYDKTK